MVTECIPSVAASCNRITPAGMSTYSNSGHRQCGGADGGFHDTAVVENPSISEVCLIRATMDQEVAIKTDSDNVYNESISAKSISLP